jgi:chemotaxis protein CheD
MTPGARETKHNIVQGECLVVDDPDALISTILGSCVAACIRDPKAGVGGMNHFLLPGEDTEREGRQYGAYLMELLINGLLARGGRRERLEAKLFGGGRMLSGMTDIGRQNAAFAERFLRDEGIRYAGGSVGGDQARRIQYWPVSGRARQHLLAAEPTVFSRERKPAPVRSDGDLELF